jgi:two-component system, chemotaxis family, protein-glutamate methylesterase/glutaminase
MSIRVLIVEDSAVVRELLVFILGSDPAIQVVGTADNGEKALRAVQELKPDVVTMDIQMAKVDGYEATRRIMESQPTPIVVVSASVDAKQVATTFRALEAGALAAVEKPTGLEHPGYAEAARNLIQTVKLMSEVKVVKRSRPRHDREGLAPALALGVSTDPAITPADIEIVVIGASTGGPPVLQTILSGLPGNFPAPVLIVQHMCPGFVQGFAVSLERSSALPVHVATQGELLLPGHVYLAPDNLQMGVLKGGRVTLNNSPPENGLRPAASYLFRSVAEVYGRKAIGILLTGMGRDGAEELKLMKAEGALTIAQDKESSVIHGMPGEAIKLNAATYILPPAAVAALLNKIVSRFGY